MIPNDGRDAVTNCLADVLTCCNGGFMSKRCRESGGVYAWLPDAWIGPTRRSVKALVFALRRVHQNTTCLRLSITSAASTNLNAEYHQGQRRKVKTLSTLSFYAQRRCGSFVLHIHDDQHRRG